MIESALLVLLGFLAATLIVFLVAPAFWSRAVRLTTLRLRSNLPLSESEIRADKDLVRAEYAVKVHQLEKAIQQSKLNAHRQFIEINRRDQKVLELEADQGELRGDLEENQNARRVLEQTLNDRLPKLENRMNEARQLLRARDQEINELSAFATSQESVIEEARAINAQQSAEVERLMGYLADIQSRDRRRGPDMGGDADLALRSELDGLRARSREQASTIDRLQSEVADGRIGAPGGSEIGDIAILRGRLAEQAAELRRLRQVAGKGEPSAQVQLAVEAERAGFAKEIEQLRHELASMHGDDGLAGRAARESKSVLKARVERLEGDVERERKTVLRLKADLAAGNERAARQAAHYVDEMRRFGMRAQPLSPKPANGNGLAARATRFADTTSDAAPVAAAVASTFGSPRARELQKALRSGADEPSAAAHAAAGAAETPVAAAAPETGDSANDNRGRLLERLKSYGEA